MTATDSCADNCVCNARPATPGGIAAADEAAWFNELDDAMTHYLNLYRQWVAAPKSERDHLDAQVHEAKQDVIERFYAQGWDK